MHFQRFLPLVALLALPSFVLFAWLSPALDYQFFCAGDNSCFREWVAALSGYFAVGAAALTLTEMARQRRLQTEIQRENVELQILGQLTVARSILSRRLIASMIASLIPQSGAWRVRSEDWLMDFQVESLFGLFASIKETLSHPEFVEFEKFSGGLYALEGVLQELEQAGRQLRDWREEVHKEGVNIADVFISAGASLQTRATFTLTRVEHYLQELNERALDFVDRWEGRVSSPLTSSP